MADRYQYDIAEWLNYGRAAEQRAAKKPARKTTPVLGVPVPVPDTAPPAPPADTDSAPKAAETEEVPHAPAP